MCVWIKGTHAKYVTGAADHANCSVGSLTHGFRSLPEVAANDDLQALLASGWVDEAGVTALPVVPHGTDTVAYAPLATASFAPQVVLVRLNARGLMRSRTRCRSSPSGQAAMPHRGDRQKPAAGGRECRLRAEQGPYRDGCG